MVRSSPGSHRFRPDQGFTLIEMLVVVAVIGMVLAAVPMAFNTGGAVQMRAAARTIAGTLVGLRNDAIRQRRVLALVFDRSLPRDPSDRPVPPLPRGMRLDYAPGLPPLVGDAASRLSFYPDGSSTGGTIVLLSRTRRLAIRVEWLSGQVTVDD